MDNRKRFRVPLWGKPQGYVAVDPEATKGATLGVNLYRADGSVVAEADIGGVAATPAGGTSIAATLWSLIQNIPANIRALASLTTSGFVRRAGDGTWSAGALQASEAAYSNTTSGLAAANAQAAIDELAAITYPSGTATTVVKSADETRASTTTDSPDSELTINVTPGLYYVECMAFLDRSGSTDANHHVVVDFSGTANVLGFRRAYQNNGTTGTDNEITRSGYGVALGSTGISGVGAMPGFYSVEGAIEATSSGAIRLSWSQNTSSATGSKVLKGSMLRVTAG